MVEIILEQLTVIATSELSKVTALHPEPAEMIKQLLTTEDSMPKESIFLI